MSRQLLPVTFAAILLLGTSSSRGEDKDVDSVKEFLKKAHAGKKWQMGPTQLSGDAVKKAYGADARFHFVFSAPPLPPGANIPEVQKAYQARVKEHQENFISVTMRIDAAGKVVPLVKVADYNTGLMAVKNEDDARVAAAAVLSLYGSDRVPPGVVQPKEVKVSRAEKGWQATVERVNQFQATVDFNEKGHVVMLNKSYSGPVPP